MASIVPNFEYDIFISYRHNDNLDGWVTNFVESLEKELRGTLKESLTIYFDKNPHDGLLETHHVDKSLEGKLKCLIFIPIISQTYCDPKSFAWRHEFQAFNKLAQEDELGRDIKLSNGNVASRILPIKIHDLDVEDTNTIENEIGGVLRAVEFIYKEAGVNRPLSSDDSDEKNLNGTKYKNQVNKVANAVKELLNAIVQPSSPLIDPQIKKIDELRSKGISHARSRKLKWAAGVAVVLLAALGYYYFSSSMSIKSSTDNIEKSVAVLPFVNMSSDKEQEYFSDGLTEDIITQLAKIKSLKVISRTSTMQYKENSKSLKEVGVELGVATILEGSVQRSGDQVRITAQLIRAETDEHLWAESYDRPMRDIFAVQREVATAIAAVLKTTLSGKEIEQLKELPTKSLTAYDQYLKGKYLMENREKPDMVNAINLFKKAIAEDSTFVYAIAGLADAYLLMSNRAWEDPKKMMAEAEIQINKALSLEPNSGPIHTSLGLLLQQKFNLKGAKIEFLKAIELEPNQNNPYNWLGSVLEFYDDFEGSIEVRTKGISYNPELGIKGGTLKGSKIYCLAKLGRESEAVRMIKESNQQDWPIGYRLLASTLWDLGKKEDAIAFAIKSGDQQLISLYRDGDSTLHVSNWSKELEQLEHQRKIGEYVSNWDLGDAYYQLSQQKKAFDYYDKAIEARDPHFVPFLKRLDPGRENYRKKLRAALQF